MNTNKIVKVIIVGNAGVGKSLLANSLCGKNAFEHATRAASVTVKVDVDTSFALDGTEIEVYNIPGLIEADSANIDRNQRCIRQAFELHPERKSVVFFVFTAGTGGRLSPMDVAAWEAMKGFLQPEAKKFNAAIGFIVNQVPNLPDQMMDNYQAETKRTIAAMCGSSSYSGEIRFVRQIMNYADLDNYSSGPMQEVRKILLSELAVLLPKAASMVPDHDATIELEHDKLKKDLNETQKRLTDIQRQHSEDMRKQTQAHIDAVREVREANDREMRAMRERNESQIAALEDQLKRNKALLDANQEKIDAAKRNNTMELLSASLRFLCSALDTVNSYRSANPWSGSSGIIPPARMDFDTFSSVSRRAGQSSDPRAAYREYRSTGEIPKGDTKQ